MQVTHANVCALLEGTHDLFHFGSHDVWTMFHSFAFDFSVWEIWGCLLTGGRLVIVPFETSRAPDQFRDLLVRERVTVLNQTPTAFALLDREDASHAADASHPADAFALRFVIFGGEALAGDALRGWFARHGDAKPAMVNMYGITETTVHVTYRRMTTADTHEHESLMGDAIPGWTLELVDDEIWVSGAGVANGYLNQPELTASKFVDGVYRSGDLARRRDDGELVYLGRRDGQVKINAFRIELEEVEAALRACAGVEQACVVVSDGRLVAYVVGGIATGAELKTKLPAHMLPAVYVSLSAMPLNVNGKLDRGALPEPVTPIRVGVASGSTMELVVAAIWARVLGNDAGLDDNFSTSAALPCC